MFLAISMFFLPLILATDPEIKQDALQIIQRWGYYGEQYPVTTEDGYILKIQRIPYGKSGPTPGKRPVIFMQHGLLCSSTNWLTNLPNESAAFIFADKGFDVWLGNFRGNTYGTQHIKYSNKDSKFWEFTWDEMGKYDLEAMVNFALEVTGQKSLYLMAHSEGTLASFAKFSSDLDFGNKVKAYFALGPFVTVEHIKGAIAVMAPFTSTLGFFASLVGYNDFSPNNWLMKLLAVTLCGWQNTNPLCANIMFLIGGPNSHQMNNSRIPVYLSHTPAGTSTRNMLHFGQMVKSGQFQMYNFGSAEKNYEHYGETVPPLYHLDRMLVPTYLFWGDLDWAADPTDVKQSILPVLKSLKGSFELKDFNHLDFIWGMRAPATVYDKIINIIQSQYES